jgi:hypothetical protein
MSEWWTYRLSDFLMFSPAAYWRMVERYNREVWPLQLLMLLAGVLLLWVVAARRPWAGRVAPAVLAVAWAWVGWAFHWERYAQINWAALYLAWGFAVQAVLLVALACARQNRPKTTGARVFGIGIGLAVIGVLLYPLIVLGQDQQWGHAEAFGMMPEPTALATLGMLIALPASHKLWATVIPVISLIVGLVTWWMLRA